MSSEISDRNALFCRQLVTIVNGGVEENDVERKVIFTRSHISNLKKALTLNIMRPKKKERRKKVGESSTQERCDFCPDLPVCTTASVFQVQQRKQKAKSIMCVKS